MKAKWLTVSLLVIAVGAAAWMIVGSYVSYAPMSATKMQNIYIDRIVTYGGCIIATLCIAIVVILMGQHRIAEPEMDQSGPSVRGSTEDVNS